MDGTNLTESLTPLRVRIEVKPSGDAIAGVAVSIGEEGGGRLGISGPPANSPQANRVQQALVGRFDSGNIDWAYDMADDS